MNFEIEDIQEREHFNMSIPPGLLRPNFEIRVNQIV